jgi:GMP reductase
MKIEDGIKLDFCDVLIRPKRSTLSSRSEVSLQRSFKFRSGALWSGIPIFASNMDTTGTFEIANVLSKKGLITAIHKHYTLEEWKNIPSEILLNISVSIGISEENFTKAIEIFKLHPTIPFLMLDVANGYSETFVNAVKRAAELFSDKIIIAGNVVTREMTEELLLAGADIIKVGIGSSAICNTRVVAGVGYPQLSAIIDCADAAHGLDGHIISDGGCQTPSDISKAFGVNADFVMLGSMFAGHDESGGELINRDNKQYKLFYGMSSDTAMKKYKGGVAEYRSSEGKTMEIPYKGPVLNTVLYILGGIRSACTYTGARNIKQLPKCTTFIRVLQQTQKMKI